ncbi:MAG: sulfatase [Planctomycetes bacterium]|nr:sulfatase [Planctomycetota bacterium]
MRKTLAALATILALPGLAGAAADADAAPPNVILILADDLGYADAGCYGAGAIRTPNLDRMAKEGMRFTDFHTASPVCTPTRSALLTGCYPRRVGLHQGVLFPTSKKGLAPSEVTIAEVLKAKGYATACIGKWHLGHHPEFLPKRQGFDSYFGIPYSNDMPTETPDGEKGVILMRDDAVIEHPVDQTTLTERYTEEALKFIAANEAGPFFLYLPHTFPHLPLHVSERFKGKSPGGLFGDVVECLDWSTGEILRALKKHGIDERTLVIFTSDNGPARHPAPPLRGGKASVWEGGMRVPCIVRWPGKVPAGATCGELATVMDVLPTIAGFAGAEVPQDRAIDGKDISALMRGEPGARTPYDVFFHCATNGRLAAVRSGAWKLHLAPPAPPAKAAKKPAAARPTLYDLASDIGEKKDVAVAHPDVIARLTALADRFEKEMAANARPAGEHR